MSDGAPGTAGPAEPAGGPGAQPDRPPYAVVLVSGRSDLHAVLAPSFAPLGPVLAVPTATEARRALRDVPPGQLCAAEVELSDGSGIALLQHLLALGWQRAVALTDSEAAFGLRAALHAGLAGFVRLAPRTRDAQDPAGAPGRGYETLSPREVEVLRRVSEGHSNERIGRELGLSPLTVKSHLTRIGRKLGTGDRAGMTYAALRRGLIT